MAGEPRMISRFQYGTAAIRWKCRCPSFSTFACAATMSVTCGGRAGDRAEGEDVNWLRHLAVRWGARNFSLVCPHCRRPASSLAFKRGRFMLGDENLVCERCGETGLVTLWRFEGLSGQSGCTDARQGGTLANSPHGLHAGEARDEEAFELATTDATKRAPPGQSQAGRQVIGG
jgi:hypothetical protein